MGIGQQAVLGQRSDRSAERRSRPVEAIRWGLPRFPGGANFSILLPQRLRTWNCCSSIGEDDDGPARVIPIDPQINRTYHYWHVFVPGVQAGQIYGFRAHGPSILRAACVLIRPSSSSILTAAPWWFRRTTAETQPAWRATMLRLL